MRRAFQPMSESTENASIFPLNRGSFVRSLEPTPVDVFLPESTIVDFSRLHAHTRTSVYAAGIKRAIRERAG